MTRLAHPSIHRPPPVQPSEPRQCEIRPRCRGGGLSCQVGVALVLLVAATPLLLPHPPLFGLRLSSSLFSASRHVVCRNHLSVFVLLLFLTGSRQSGRRLVMPFANHWDRTASRIHSRMPTTSRRSVHAPSSGWPPGRAPVPPRQQLSLSLPSSPPFHPLLQSCKSKNGS